MDVLIDQYEIYKIMVDVFYEHIPDDKKIEALAQVAERITYEIKEVSQNESKIN